MREAGGGNGWWTWPRAGPELDWTSQSHHFIFQPADQWGGNNSNAHTNWLICEAIIAGERDQ